MRGGNPTDYKNRRFNISDIYRKWKSRYDFDSEEIQNLDSQGPDCVYSEKIDLSVARSPQNPYIVGSGNNGGVAQQGSGQSGVSGRSFRIFGYSNNTQYSFDSNGGNYTVDSTAWAGCWINKPGSGSNYIILKHGHGYRGDFKQLYLFWPAQSTQLIRIEVYKFDDMPWQCGDAAT